MATVTPERLAVEPLDVLLADMGVRLVESVLPATASLGCVGALADGSAVLVLPPGRPEWERDTTARMLLGRFAGVALAPLPATVEMTVLDA